MKGLFGQIWKSNRPGAVKYLGFRQFHRNIMGLMKKENPGVALNVGRFRREEKG